ncbi:hypothetical protein H0H87_002524 [Tephrocybe sp. NHM501043]|nr:hypothetical protein H0H87_002524 [Tephrocybe sp. NHM501043]
MDAIMPLEHHFLSERSGSSDTGYAQRFGDWSSMQYLSVFGKDGASRTQTFYNGETLSTRMSSLRQAIIYVRENWKDYSLLMADLRSYIADLIGDAYNNQQLQNYLPIVLTSFKVWNSEIDTVPDDEGLSVIRLYTSKAGYDQIFRIINQAFRTDDVAEQQRRLRCVVFLIELLNIDLFNYTLRKPATHNFEGTVYRGVIFSDDQLQDFKVLAARPVKERYWAIPLAMMSASTDRNVALKHFAGLDSMADDTEKSEMCHPFLWRIHVIALQPRYLQIYREKFPTSVVSTICAVPIRELSDYAEEDEVLLRGPFFQLVCLQEEVFEGRDRPIHVMDLVMLNANRDHPSTMQLSAEEGEKARQLFASLVGMCRAEICKELAGLYGLREDATQHEEMFRAAMAKLEALEIQGNW